jgi:murein DD-endopeptidase MepM/ murein hydrolase activator NlpD
VTSIAWPLQQNHIRRGVRNNAFGNVRNAGSKAHQGWDLVAAPMTPCYAIADGIIRRRRLSESYGNMVYLEFEHRQQTLYAVYCHLSLATVLQDDKVRKSDVIAMTGNTGNASNLKGEDQHLHFEIRTMLEPGSGLAGRIDPASLYGFAPIGVTYFEPHHGGLTVAGWPGLRVPGVNIRSSTE